MAFQKIRSFLFNFFHFNKQERNGIFVLCLLIVILFMLRILIPFMRSDDTLQLMTIVSDPITTTTTTTTITTASETPEYKEQEWNKDKLGNASSSSQRFVFDPNKVTQEDALKLGFSKKLTAILINFRNKGGKFFKPEDLKKLYGLSPALYEDLESYILIPGRSRDRDSVFSKKPHTYEKKIYTKELVELNSADSLSLVFLKGIGPGFTKRIIKYRTMLGGFHSIGQLKEVYGMNDSLYIALSSQVKLDASVLSKIPINAIDFNSLRKHPYFNFQSAQAIINFRLKHGKLTEDDIRNLGIFTDEKLVLILPYLSY